MSTYQVSVLTGRDSEIAELDSLNHVELRSQIARFIADLMNKRSSEIWDDASWEIRVSDAQGLVLYVAHLELIVSPATMKVPAFD